MQVLMRFGFYRGLLFAITISISFSLAPSNVTLYTSQMTWNEAQRFCRSQGQSLVTIESLDKQTAIEFFLNHPPWNNVKSKKFWTGLHAPFSQKPYDFRWEETCSDPSLFRWGPLEPSISDLKLCVYALLDSGYLKWHTDQCTVPVNNFMCEDQLEECTYDVIPQTRGDSKISADVTGTDPEMCMARCLTFTSSGGLPCWGFNFHKDSKSCFLLATNDAYRLDTRNSASLKHDLYIKRCQIKPLMDTRNYDNVTDRVCTEYPVSSCGDTDGECKPPTTPTPPTTPIPLTTPTEQITSTTTTPIVSCPCKPTNHVTNVTDLEQRIKDIVNEIKIDRRETSLARRRLISVDDKRPSSKGIGYVAIGFMTLVFGGLILMDLGVLIEHSRRAIRRLRHTVLYK